MTVTRGAARGDAAWWSVLSGLCLLLLAPLTLADLPPLLDYPNHLARLFVLAFVDADPVLARFYQPHWAIIPNLALDLTVPPLLRALPVHVAGRIVIGVILLLPVLGAVAWHRALTGRMSYWPLASVLFVYNAALLRGFLNFIASVGLALLFAAVWVAWRDRRPGLTILAVSLGAVALFLCHLTGLLFFAILIGAHEMAWVRGRPVRAGKILWRVAVGAVVFAVPAILYAVSDLGQMPGAPKFRDAADKAQAALFPVINYFMPLDLMTAALCVAVAVLCLARRWCVVPLQGVLALCVLIVLFLALPHGFKATSDLDTRFIVMAAALAPATVIPTALPRRAGLTLGLGFLLLFGVRMGVVMTVWEAWAPELAAFRAVIAPVQPGDVVLTVRLPRGNEPSIWTSVASVRRLSDGTVVDGHLPALLLIEHRAWWPFLFDIPSQQPIETNEPYRTMTERIDSSPDPIALLARGAPEMALVTHVLVMGPAPGPGLIGTEGLKPMTAAGTASLFEVVRRPR
ncbi:MAG: hypothetical protein EXR07_05440 [Acetobacteraceae bacterium]|nr:hypothetical protein [Acetobacteraceae bacterium]